MRRLALIVGFVLIVISGLACWAEFSAIAAVAETRPTALGAGLLAVAVFTLLAWRSRRSRRSAVVGLILACACSVFAARLLWFTYRETPVTFQSGEVTLRGTLFAPREDGVHPGIVFVHGSGRETRSGFFYLAKLFARHGFAALTYDKRGAGESGGSTYDVGYDGYAADAVAAIRALASRAEADPARIGILGHSEGGWVAPLMAERDPHLSFVIVTSTTDLTPAEQVVYETGADVRAAGFSTQQSHEATEIQRQLMQYQRSGNGKTALTAALKRAVMAPWFKASGLPQTADEYGGEWWTSVMDFDPLPHWRQVHCPVLMVSGGKDTKSDVQQSQRRIHEALMDGGNGQFMGKLFPEMEHGTVEWWLPDHIPPPRFPKGYPELLIDWTREQVGE
jgi:pimeloyl-ACP methyl ester carboxylesterase